uniref:Uncharacterized protein n=1 Tax=Chrysotila carterae TaxID=13221 RepID=A0A7S4BR36_CHRCT|mmetsp:Transcript_2096/g.4387  ORF Transcript_2096/g.4387 Transcript_2096/m.4387 type:complete len:164 (+) Transcript_2096:164-655(+)|eukprot:6199685-Pleurochrysis_carterae.AAC.1
MTLLPKNSGAIEVPQHDLLVAHSFAEEEQLLQDVDSLQMASKPTGQCDAGTTDAFRGSPSANGSDEARHGVESYVDSAGVSFQLNADENDERATVDSNDDQPTSPRASSLHSALVEDLQRTRTTRRRARSAAASSKLHSTSADTPFTKTNRKQRPAWDETRCL